MKRLFLTLLIAVLGCGGGGGTQPEPNPPTIVTGPSAGSLTTSSAVITWTTDHPCDSKVRFGRLAYEDSAYAPELVKNHSISLRGLMPLTTYHFNVTSVDADGLEVTSSDRTFMTLSPVPDLVAKGWSYFEEGNYDSAQSHFEQALTYEPHSVDALEGVGWTKLKLYDFGGSQSAFETALGIDEVRIDCLVGLGFAYLAVEDYENVLTTCFEALNVAGETYTFAHDHSITDFDLRYCRILAFVGLGRFGDALDEIKIVKPEIEIDPLNPATWNGYLTFEEALLALIEQLAEDDQGHLQAPAA